MNLSGVPAPGSMSGCQKDALISSHCSAERNPSPFSSAESSPTWPPDGAGAPGMEAQARVVAAVGISAAAGVGRRQTERRMQVSPCRAHPAGTSPGVKPITGSTLPGGKGSAHSITLSGSSSPLLGNICTLVKAGRKGVRHVREKRS